MTSTNTQNIQNAQSNKNKQYKRSNEPVIWGLFGGGGMLSAFMLPAIILVTGLLVPLGFFDAMSYERVLAFSQSWIGKLALWVIISLPIWHGIHRFYHLLHDLGQHSGRKLTFIIFYGFTVLITLASLYLLLTL
ncbi:MAG: fumarate reductase subunit FrdD [Colwellia sp.]